MRDGDNDPYDLDRLVAIRRDIHAHPELGFEEVRTAGIVASYLEDAGITVHRGLGRTGVVGTLRCGSGPGRIALRADMDALAMPEVGTPDWRSTRSGVMHACGHDGHTAMLLGAARHLARVGGFDGTVHFIFQPAEEGVGGARAMVADGLFDRFPVDRIFGLHCMPGLAPDAMAVAAGPQLAASDRWEVVFTGEGTHGAKPHLGRDAMIAAGDFLGTLQRIVAREVDPLEPAVISVCAIAGGDFKALNVIPDSVRVGGTARSYSAPVRDLLQAAIGRVAAGVAAAHGVACALDYRRGVPPVVNDTGVTAVAQAAAVAALGAGKVALSFPPNTAGEDFAVYLDHVPGCFAWIGNGPAEDGALHHNTRFDFNDAAIETGVRYWTSVVQTALPA